MAYYRCGAPSGSPVATPQLYIEPADWVAFNSGYTHTVDTKIKCKFTASAWNSNFLFGTFTNNGNSGTWWFNPSQWQIARSGQQYQFPGSNVIHWGEPYIVEAEGTTFTIYPANNPVDVLSYTLTSATADAGVSPIGIFCRNTNGSGGFTNDGNPRYQLYYFEIYENNTLLHRFVPACNNAQFCLYDEVGESYTYDTTNSGKYVVPSHDLANSATTLIEISKYESTGLSSTAWTSSTDNSTTLTKDGGTYEAYTLTDPTGTYLLCDSSNGAYYSTPTTTSYSIFGIVCAVDSSFTPIQSNDWYSCSCILGQELGGQQRDCAIVIDKNGYFGLGWANSSIISSNVYALDDTKHTLYLIVNRNTIRLMIDGEVKARVNIYMTGSEMSNIGIFWNRASNGTKVYGKIYGIGLWAISGDFQKLDELPVIVTEEHST